VSGNACTSSAECCTNLCIAGFCSANQCLGLGQTCTGNTECCTHSCVGTVCAAGGNGGSCGVTGTTCTMDSQCCSTNCQGGFCEAAYFCQANGDVCGSDKDCCGNACSVEDGGPGDCITVNGGGGGGCTQDGNPCTGGSGCCSRICSDPGTGSDVCLPATGCRLTGDWCVDSPECCGYGVSGNVQCTNGRCDNGTSCNGTGNICGAPVLPDGGKVNASQNCCDGMKSVCKLDSSGIPRCFGGGTSQCPTGYTGVAPCCIASGQTCQFKDQCCGSSPCLPNPDGGQDLVCAPPLTCVAVGGGCTNFSDGGTDCCSGTVCGSGGACQVPITDGGSCQPNGTTCSASSMCCSMICAMGDGGLVCTPPPTCSPQGNVCTSTTDCCSGLTCNIPAGMTSGTCDISVCIGIGQTCSLTNSNCCTGLFCLDQTGGGCDVTGSCTCQTSL
jgi:hypothetical protein